MYRPEEELFAACGVVYRLCIELLAGVVVMFLLH